MKGHYFFSHSLVKGGFSVLFFLLLSTSLHAQKFDLNESGILPEIELPEMAKKPFLKNAKRARPFKMNQIVKNRGLGKGANLQLHLFNNKKFESVVERRTTDINGVTTIVLKLKDHKFAHGYISISQNSYLLNVEIPELNEKYITRGDKATGTTYLLQLEESAYRDFDCGTTSPSTNNEGSQNLKKSTEKSGLTTQAIDVDPVTCEVTLPGAADPAVIDIMVIYSPAAEDWAINNGIDMNTLIATNIAESNEVVSNNNLGITFSLVHSEKLNYIEQGGIGTDWGNLLTYGDGNLDEVHSIRKTYNADLVVMLTHYSTSGPGGIATPLNSRYGMPTNAFSVVRVNFAAGSDAFIHEIGHMMGAGHHKGQTNGPGPTTFIDWPTNTWSAGWRWQGTDLNYYSDIMTYQTSDQFPDGNPTAHVPYFSDPNTTVDGQSIGDPLDGDNARTLLEMKHYVARYEESAQYCLVNPPDNYLNEYFLSSVNIGSISHTSPGAGYSDYTTLATCMLPGETQQLSVNIGRRINYATYFSVWIDWNDNKEFDSEELFFTSESSSLSFTTEITAPVGFPAGPKRMRLRTHPNGIIDPCGGSDLGEIEDYTINLGEATPCTTPLVPQNFVLTEVESNNASFSWDPIEGATSYELRYRKTGATQWNLITDIRFPFYTLTGLELLIEYEAQVRSTCQGAPSEFTDSIVFSTTDYCSSSGTDSNISITRVQVGTIDNESSGDASGYTDFTSLSTDLKQGDSYNLTIDNSGPSGEGFPKGYRAWIDYNSDGDFEDPEELVVDVVSTTNTASGTFTVPLNYTGERRMRISLKMFGSRPSPCGDFQYGEVEDYTVNLIESCETPTPYYTDGDGDGFGDINDTGTSFCSDPGAGWSLTNTDCNDNENTVYPGAPELCDGQINNCNSTDLASTEVDNDGDGYVECSIDAGGWDGIGSVIGGDDCNDNDATINPGATEVCDGVDNNCDGNIDEGLTTSTWYVDSDGDGYGVDDAATNIEACENPGTGYASQAGDCNDNNAAINPGATEVCDGVDNDCDGLTDDEDPDVTGQSTWYADSDGDGYGDANISLEACEQPTGYVADNTDCNDNDPAINPGATEVCDGVDNNCDGNIDEGLTTSTWYTDGDGDGYGVDDPATNIEACENPGTGYASQAGDCNDNNAAINPGATEVCDGVDNDCDGLTDDEDPDVTGQSTWYADADGDGYGDANISLEACEQPTGYVADNTDCDDSNSTINPGATEVDNDGIDQDCDGEDSTGESDTDGDGIPDEIDNCPFISNPEQADLDLDGKGDACDEDIDGDGVLNEDDCDPFDPSIYPGAFDIRGDGIDQDCDGKDEAFDCLGSDVLNITELCSDEPSKVRNWFVNNPSDCAVEVKWELRKDQSSGDFIAYPGDNEFSTPVAEKFPTQVVITWKDSKGKDKKRTMASTGTQCPNLSSTLEATIETVNNVQVYPNPISKDGFWLQFPAELEGRTITGSIHDYNGRFLISNSFEVPVGGGEIFWNLDHSGWDQGVYLLNLESSGKTWQIQLMKN